MQLVSGKMASASQIPASELIKGGIGLGDVQESRKTKDEYRKQKDLEEERKLGIAPAMVDVETGRDINPHIPEFIAKNPWYVPSSGPTLKHQRPHPERQVKMSTIDSWYRRGPTNKVATKFKEGACENCGSMTHKKKECFERPRKIGARWTGMNFASDDYAQPDLKLNWDAKRDRWNGYDPGTYSQVVEEYEKREQTRKQLREAKMAEGKVEEDDSKGEQTADEDMYADDADMAGVTVDMDSRTRITVRNLRIREDTAKYLYNLDPNGPYYDPKSRSMRENPFANMPGKEREAAKFAGENFIRYTGEVVQANEAQVFAWQARCKGIDVHALAEPTKLEAMKREYEKQKIGSKKEHKEKLLEKYGGEEYLDAPPKELLLAQTENYVEYSRKGKVIKGEERPVVRSRYEEDKYINNHTSVWGSYWRDGQWGYSCCHSFVKFSYCIGKVGYEVNRELPSVLPAAIKQENDNGERKFEEEDEDGQSSSNETRSGDEVDSEKERVFESERQTEIERREREDRRREKIRKKRKRQEEKKRKNKKKEGRKGRGDGKQSSSSETEEDKKNDEELKKAIAKAKQDWRAGEKMALEDDRKRKYHSTYETQAPTDAEMEAYRLTQIHSADPMAGYIAEKRRRGK
ncbi:unnamed protein product [Enterobius vermicularis]|uniref:Pre-mRNA-splicing factor SLU7 n=1 Tax=Enterobius vermicularis TaxID=51028 RepID=A0A0N4VKM7_ENTVE|nr:unnamed protein product [Enterobius vermicularis]